MTPSAFLSRDRMAGYAVRAVVAAIAVTWAGAVALAEQPASPPSGPPSAAPSGTPPPTLEPKAAPVTPPADVQASLVARGQSMVEANCKRCHAIGADDQSPHETAPPFRVIAERYPSENLAEALAEGIVAGHPDMPVFVMKAEQIEAFLAYLNNIAPASRPRR